MKEKKITFFLRKKHENKSMYKYIYIYILILCIKKLLLKVFLLYIIMVLTPIRKTFKN